jgi:hypothetical protein
MRTISKGTEPSCLTVWKKKNPHGVYDDLDKTEEGKVVRATIRDHALNEQFYLCAYCCKRIQEINACHNEHVEAQKLNPGRTLDFSNRLNRCCREIEAEGTR